MRNFKLLLVFVAVFATLQASALSRDCNLTVKVVSATGESLEGQRVMLVQTDYSMTYGASETTLDAAGECRLKVYSGNHRLTVERAGYAAYAEDFPVTGDMTLNVTLTEDVRNPFSLCPVDDLWDCMAVFYGNWLFDMCGEPAVWKV